MNNEELSAKIKSINADLDKLKQQKIEIGVKKQQLSEKVESLKPEIEAAFGTTDIAELLKKKEEFLKELETIEL